jgi:diguanylate cyclase (GGDEF)-like protein/PAS domain S-box-containing protein
LTQSRVDDQHEAGLPYEELLEFLYLTPVGLIKFKPCGTIVMVNPMAVQLLMPLLRTPELTNIYAALQSLVPDLQARIAGFAAVEGEFSDRMVVHPQGTATFLTLAVNKISPASFMVVIEDISRARQQEARIREDQQRLRAIFNNIRDYAIYMVDPAGRLDGWNRSLNRVGGWNRGDVAGASLEIFLPPGKDGADKVAGLLGRARQGGSAEIECWVYRKDGSAFWGSTIATMLPDGNGCPNGFVLLTRDLTERKLKEDQLVTFATTDPLTGALNRRAGEARLADAFNTWQRSAAAFGLAMVDVDHFKSVNDTWGHDTGDAVLVSLTRLFGEKLRDRDLVIRWGGEEFLLLLHNVNHDVATMVAERVRGAIEMTEIQHGGSPIRVTASIGIAIVSTADTCPEDLVRQADQALYAAKRGGRNRVGASWSSAPRSPENPSG